MSETIIKTTEEGIKYLEAHPPSGTAFQLAISDSFTFAGKPDTIGAGKAVILDKMLGLGYMLSAGGQNQPPVGESKPAILR